MGEFSQNRAAWLIAGFLGRKFMKDLLGRWSVLPVLAVACCLWNKWRSSQLEGKLEQAKLEEVRRSTRRQLQLLRTRSASGAPPSAGHSSERRPGDRLGGIPTSSLSTMPEQQRAQRQHLSPTAVAAAAAAAAAASGSTDKKSSISAAAAAVPAPKDALASELWAWLGGVGSGRSCNADRPSRSRGGEGGAAAGGRGAGEWRGAFHNRMGNLPRRNAFKTARGKVYLRDGRRGGGGGSSRSCLLAGGLEPVREEDESGVATATATAAAS